MEKRQSQKQIPSRTRISSVEEYQNMGRPFDKTSVGILEETAGTTVAKVIEFYLPNNFRKSVKWVSPEQRGKIIEFASEIKKSA